MRVLWFVALFVGLGISFSGGQQPSPSALPKPDSQLARVKVYTVGPEVTAPQLLPLNVTDISTEKCKKKMDGKVVLSVLVDEKGQPRNLMFLHPLGTDLDKFALQIAAAERFKPGTHDGAPVAVAQSVELNMQACVEDKKNDAGKKIYWLRLRSQPVQKFGALPQPPEEVVLASGNAGITHVGGSVTYPVPLNNVEAEFSDEAKREKYQGTCLISLIVDAHGMPQDVRMVKPLKYGLSEKAIEAVNKYRFRPAMKNGEPVPVMVNVEVNFHLY
jgi:TonB family protein